MKKFIITGVFVAVALALIIVYNFVFSGKSGYSDVEPEYRISAEKLFEEFEVDEEASNKKYLSKIIEVEGKIIKSEISETKRILFLDTGSDIGMISCSMFDTESKISFTHNSMIKLRGKCAGFLMDVTLTDCVIIGNGK